MLDEVGDAQLMDEQVIESAQSTWRHRRNLVHRRIEDHAEAMSVEEASRNLLTYLTLMPARWE